MNLFGISIVELFGYLGSFVVLISLMMDSIVKLRWINLVGALMFTLYAIIIKAYPAIFMNLGIVFIDIYYLLKLYRAENTKKYC